MEHHFFNWIFFDFVFQNQPIWKFENLKNDMCARKYGICARKYCLLGHQTDELWNDVISSYAVAGFHITIPIFIYNLSWVYHYIGWLVFGQCDSKELQCAWHHTPCKTANLSFTCPPRPRRKIVQKDTSPDTSRTRQRHVVDMSWTSRLFTF